MGLEEKVVMITGASSGIGRSCALQFARAGANVVLAARRGARLSALARDLGVRFRTKCAVMSVDVRSRDELRAGVAALPEDLAAIDVLVNNAGVSLTSDRIQDTDPGVWEVMIATNLNGALYAIHTVLPGMLERGRGHIVNVGSLASHGHYCYPGANVYAATKRALKAVSETLRLDLLGTPIRVSQVDPGPTRTELSEVRWGSREAADSFYQGFQPLSPDDVAEAIVFCTARPAHVNVDNLVVNSIDMAGPNLHRGRG